MSTGAGAARPFYWLDVFSDLALAGNGLAVVLDADGLAPETMLAFAREVGLSETTFVQTPTAGDADYLNRIWTVRGEIPFAGHPSLGTAVAVALHRGNAQEVRSHNFTQQTGVGTQRVDSVFDGGAWSASVEQEPASFGRTFDRGKVAGALSIGPEGMDAELSCQIASTGLPALLAPVSDLETLARCRPDFDALRELESSPALNLYAFVHERGSRTVRARCFGADLSGIEDPATGSAAGPLLAYLQDCLDIDRIVVEQGIEMGRPSRIEARMENGHPVVSGAVTVLAEGTVHLPDKEG